jgi:hypothetical protein
MSSYRPRSTDTVESLRRVVEELNTRCNRLRVDLSAEMMRREMVENQLETERAMHALSQKAAADYRTRMEKIVAGYQFYARVSSIRREPSNASNAGRSPNAVSSPTESRQAESRKKDEVALEAMLSAQGPDTASRALDAARERQVSQSVSLLGMLCMSWPGLLSSNHNI